MPRCTDPAGCEVAARTSPGVAAALAALLLGLLPGRAGAEPPYRGRTLADVLNEIGGPDPAPRLQLRGRPCAIARAGRADGDRRACAARAASRSARPRGRARRRHRLCRRAPDARRNRAVVAATPPGADAAGGSRRREQSFPSRRRFAARADLSDPGRARGAAAARRRLAQGRAPSARRREQRLLGSRVHPGRRAVGNARRARRPGDVRALSPAARVESDERARPAHPGQPGGVRGRIHRGVRRPHQLGHRRTLHASGRRSLLRGGLEPLPHERAGVDALCRRSRPVAPVGETQQPRLRI